MHVIKLSVHRRKSYDTAAHAYGKPNAQQIENPGLSVDNPGLSVDNPGLSVDNPGLSWFIDR